MKRHLLLFLGIAVSMSALAQNKPHKNCATMERIPAQERAQRIATLNTRMDQWLADYQKSPVYKSQQNYVIPVVFHILYNTPQQNISDEQILSQLEVINNDFAGLNADSTRIPAVFKPLFGKSTIQFCLAKTDPEGNPTTGIIRKETSVVEFPAFSTDVVKADQGGDPTWDTNKYLNIYSCNLGGGLYGFATFPDSAGAVADGVVCKFNAIGVGGSAIPPSNFGRTVTHEIGHYLGLYHVWGDENCGNDQIEDTPTQAEPNFGCVSFPNISCNNGPHGDMFMNYMDYSDDSCLAMFTHKQMERMLSVLNGPRSGLISSNGCGVSNRSEKNTANWKLNVYPNPTIDGRFSLTIDKYNYSEGYSVTVTNLMGETIAIYNDIKQPTISIEINASTGVYFVKVESKNYRLTKYVVVR